MKKELLKENEAKDEKDEEEEDEEDIEKSIGTVLGQLQQIVDSQTTLIDTQKAVGEAVVELSERVKAIEVSKDDNLSPKSDLPLKPKESDKEDIGAEVKAPNNDPYPTGTQAKLDADGEGTESDDSKLSMEKKTQVQKANFDFTTETPRPNAAAETVNKSYQDDFSPILKDAREGGYEGLSQVARNILAGKYYTPSTEEIGF